MGRSLSRVLLTMKTRRRRNVLEDRLTITQRKKRSNKNIENDTREENALPIPIDLVMEIFSRLPAKSIARCRCVSKPWASILRSSDFTKLFSTRSSARPQFLFAYETMHELIFFSSPQLENLDENSSPLVVNYHKKFSFNRYYVSPICRPVHGFVCLINQQISSRGRDETVPTIYNPSTGQSFLLPKVKTRRYMVVIMLGYDPVDKLFKLLSMTYGESNVVEEHQVLTIGTGNHSWRMIKCSRPYYSLEGEICINGVLYYIASDNSSSKDSMVACFDVRSEKFSFIQVVETFIENYGRLINYNGKLGILSSENSGRVDGRSRSIELHVLEDVQKHEWSKHTYVLSSSWKNIVGNDGRILYFVGITRSNEIVFAPFIQTLPFYVYYYNIQRMEGMEAVKSKTVGLRIFLDHVEDLNLCNCFN